MGTDKANDSDRPLPKGPYKTLNFKWLIFISILNCIQNMSENTIVQVNRKQTTATSGQAK